MRWLMRSPRRQQRSGQRKRQRKTECSNLIISSTVRTRPGDFADVEEACGVAAFCGASELCGVCGIVTSGIRFFRGQTARPPVHLILRQTNLRQHPANILRNQIVDGLRMMIERRHRRHNHRASLLYS